MGLLRKQEAICIELGYRAGLAYCYWGWGLLLQAQGDASSGKERLDRALPIFTELNMPIERDKVRGDLAEIAEGSAPG